MLTLLIALVSATAAVIESRLGTPTIEDLLQDARVGCGLLAMGTVIGIPFGRAVASARAMAKNLPTATYMFPKWTVEVLLGAGVGRIAGSIVVALAGVPEMLWIAASLLPFTLSMLAGARKRFKQPEFAIPWSWYFGER